jgi:hypothetical protein
VRAAVAAVAAAAAAAAAAEPAAAAADGCGAAAGVASPFADADALLGGDVGSLLGRRALPLAAHLEALPPGADRQARFVSRVLELARAGRLVELSPFPLLLSPPRPPAPAPAAAGGGGEALGAQQRRYAQLCRLAPLLDGTRRPAELLWRAPGIGARELDAVLSCYADHVALCVRPVALDALAPGGGPG